MNFASFEHFYLPYQKNKIDVDTSLIYDGENALLYYLKNIKKIGKSEELLNYLINNSDLTVKNQENLNALEFVLVNNTQIKINASSLKLLIDKIPSDKALVLSWFNQIHNNLNKDQWTTFINNSKLKAKFSDQELLTVVALLVAHPFPKHFNNEHWNNLYARTKLEFDPFLELHNTTLKNETKENVLKSLQDLEIVFNYKEIKDTTDDNKVIKSLNNKRAKI